jgi:hypothetical protein
VVVVTGAGTVVCSDVVVVLLVGAGVDVDEQADSDTSAAATMHGMISLFIYMTVVFCYSRIHRMIA